MDRGAWQATVVKNPPANAGDIRDMGLIPGSGRSPGGRNAYPLQYSCLGNPIDRGDGRARVHRMAKNPPARRCGFYPWVGKIPWRRAWQPTPVFLPGKSHRQRSLVGYRPWGCQRVRHNLVTKHQQQSDLSRVRVWEEHSRQKKQSVQSPEVRIRLNESGVGKRQFSWSTMNKGRMLQGAT